MIKFSAWNIDAIGSPLGRQYDNLTRSLDIVGDIPDGWTWDALLQIGDNLNIISLSPSEGGLHATLTADMLAIKGKYRLQLRASQSDKIRHTNIITVDVSESISGDAKWPEIPTEFSQAEALIRELNAHPPIPGSEGFWMLWNPDADEYETSDLPLPEGGGPGVDGGYYTPSIEQLTDTTMTVSFVASKDDMPPVAPVQVTLPRGKDGDPGTPGKNGEPGKDGVSPQASVQQTDAGATITITDATGTTTAEVKNGADGQQGPPGADGKDGSPGVDGKTPEKGVDYWTEADKAEIVADTVAALPVYNGEVQDVG